MSHYDLFTAALSEARSVMRAADEKANDMAGLIEGRLRKVDSYRLKRLKRELSQFNAATGKWKEQS